MADGGIQRNLASGSDAIIKAFQAEAAEDTSEIAQEKQIATTEGLKEAQEGMPPYKTKLKDDKIQNHSSRVNKAQNASDVKRMLPVDKLEEKASQFQERNRELNPKTLVALRQKIQDLFDDLEEKMKNGEISSEECKEALLNAVLNTYQGDVTLADDALDYLLATSEGDLAKLLQEVKDELNASRGKEIRAGRNIQEQVKAATAKGLGTPTSLRNMYRDIVNNPREATTLFEELSQKYAFEDLKKVMHFLLHSIGDDLKSKGPSIEPGELSRLYNETRTLQAIFGVYRFFRSRMNLVKTLFENSSIPLPAELTFEKLSKEFMALAAERYPSPDKVVDRAMRLGIKKHLEAEIITISQFRDGVREVAPNKIYKSLQHRDDLYSAILEALENLEDEREREEENVGDV